jgi:hypothetical protein
MQPLQQSLEGQSQHFAFVVQREASCCLSAQLEPIWTMAQHLFFSSLLDCLLEQLVIPLLLQN